MPASTTPTGRRVIVTGATGGIGRAIVDALVATGCAVAACDLPGAPMLDIAQSAVTAAFDVRDRAAVEGGVAEAIAALGGCDAVVANAGIVDTIHRAERRWRKRSPSTALVPQRSSPAWSASCSPRPPLTSPARCYGWTAASASRPRR